MASQNNKASQRGASRYETDEADIKIPVPGWVWLVAGIVVGGFIMFLVGLEPGNKNVLRDTPTPQQQGGQVSGNVNQNTTATPNTTPQQTVTPVPADKDGQSKFDFYTMLPDSELVVPPEAVPEKAPPQPTPEQLRRAEAIRAQALLDGKAPPAPNLPTPTSTQFFLQAGSFPTRDRAESVRAQVTLLGQSVRVESGRVADKTWYRVMVGPFASRDQVTRAQQQLSSNGFNNLLMQQKAN